MNQELEKIYNILVFILGESKNGFDERTMQYQFPCPRCIENKGERERLKYNLEINISNGVYKCWSCESESNDMHGSISKLIRMYGNEKLLAEYKGILRSIKENELYKLNLSENELKIDTSAIEKEDLKFPQSFRRFEENGNNNRMALNYLQSRGIGWDIINEYKLGYTSYQEDNKKGSYRIIIPSYNALGDLNYWVGRDYLPKNEKTSHVRLKYDNPKVEKKSIIFNEDKIQWDADITLVEGTFDHIVIPNSVPLLGKVLNQEFKLYWDLITKANANVNIWLDNDAYDSAITLYSLLNHGRLYGKIRIVNSGFYKDPSEVYQHYGKKGIIQCLQCAKQIPEYMLFN